MPISAEQQAYFENNTQKPANIASWMTFQFTHPDWTEDINLVAIKDWQSVEFDSDFYTFEGVTYRPVSMEVALPNESKDSNGTMSLKFARAGAEVKKRMAEITPANALVPKTYLFRQYQEGVTLPVARYDGFISKDYPKIGGQDVTIQSDIYNPSLLTSNLIITLDIAPELRTS